MFVPGALYSVGDLQYSQGDGRITPLDGIKVSGWIDPSIELIPDGVRRYGISRPTCSRGP